MNKYLLFLISLFFSSAGFAQNGNTGINTKTPHANLDVQAVTSNNGIADGIISPRVTKAGLMTKTSVYGTSQTSALVYVTDANAASSDAKFTNIDAIGYYYFDGTIWQKMDYSVKKWDLNGNTITDGQFLGTLNAKALQFKYSNQNAGFLNDLNTSYGFNALPFTTIGNDNAAFGKNVLSANTTGYLNTAIGNNALSKNTVGYANTAIGLNALSSNVTHHDNVAIGTYALQANTANNNVAIGSGAMKSNTFGNLNVAIGINALAASTNTNGSTAVGGNALQLTTGAGNTAIGSGAMKGAVGATVTANKNVAIGAGTLGEIVGGNLNVAIGNYAMGKYAGNADDHNTAIGSDAGSFMIDGKYNTFIGSSSNVTNNSSGTTYLTAIGRSATIGASATVNATVIGARATVTRSNSIVLGRAVGNVSGTDNIGIGTTAPTNALHVVATTNPLKLEGVKVPTVSGAYSMLVIGADGVVYQAPSGTGIVIAGLTPVKDDSILLATIAKQAEQIKLLTESLAELKNTVNALSPTYTAQNK